MTKLTFYLPLFYITMQKTTLTDKVALEIQKSPLMFLKSISDIWMPKNYVDSWILAWDIVDSRINCKLISYSWQSVPNPLFSENLLFTDHAPLLKFCPAPFPTFIPLLFLFLRFFSCMGDYATFDVLFYLMILWIKPWYFSTRRTLVCVLCNNITSLLRSVTCGLFVCNLIGYHTHSHTNKDTQHTQGPRDWHTQINTY